ncbi:MAG TPA: TonB-dependent receptor, partial [Caulobacteraceae bacterium]|nr:TonB-dependent receptor [Caulobacteraceae bacterium]
MLSAGVAVAQERGPITIEPQALTTALHEFGSQTSRQVMFSPGLLSSKTSAGVSAASDEQMALAQLLRGTGLTYRREGDVYLIVQAGEGGSPQDQGAAGGGAEVEELIVTAQKKEEQIQDVPIAISAFTQRSLDAQKIEGGFDLLKAIPNVTFSKSNFSGYNFSIRGIGTKAVSATTDPGVAVAFNNTTLIVNRLFEQEYYDIERVEVLRGPQGTLYGRNATSGVINVLSARPRMMEFEGDVEVEVGNYNAQRLRGMINVPIGDTVAIRLAGATTKRDGFGTNLAASDPLVTTDVREDVDGRDLWSTRLTVGWEPIEQIRVNAMWERFEEDDNRVRTSKQLCHHDPAPQTVGSFDWANAPLMEPPPGYDPAPPGLGQRAPLSQGCLPGSLYDDGAFGTPNGASLPYVSAINFAAPISGIGRSALHTGGGLGMNPYIFDPDAPPPPCPQVFATTTLLPINQCQPDPYGGAMQSRDLRTIHSTIEPTYRAKADIFELTIDADLTDSLTLTSQTLYTTDEYYASQDYNRFATFPIFNDSEFACGETPVFDKYGNLENNIPNCSPEARGTYKGGYYNLTPGGVFTDPQLGPSSSLLAQDLSQAKSDQFNQEFRLASNFDAPLNFSMGSNFTRFETQNDYYVFINALSLFTYFFPFNTNDIPCDWDFVAAGGLQTYNPNTEGRIHSGECVYVDPNPLESINGEGHNYFRSANPYELTSSALFGELYWQATDTLKVTLGARMTWDRKVFTPIPSQLLLRDYRWLVPPGAGTEECVTGSEFCPLAGTGIGGRGSVALPDIVQEWREPTGRIIVDWKPDLTFTDETMVYGSISHGYKGGGANPPNIAPPAGYYNAINSGMTAPPIFEPEFIDAYEVGTKNTLLDGALVLNGSAFFYDYTGYQVSKIVDRSASNENFDAKIQGLELEWIYSPMRNLRFNGSFGALRTEIADGERSIDLMDRTQGGGSGTYIDVNGVEQPLAWDQWMVLKPFVSASSNCVVPLDVIEDVLLRANYGLLFAGLCPGGGIGSVSGGAPYTLEDGRVYVPGADAPNGGAGFFDELGGNELPNAPHWTASLGAQYRMTLPGGWDATLRGDFYWQAESFARVYNTEYDRLKAWTNTNISFWVENPDWGVT